MMLIIPARSRLRYCGTK